MKETIAINEVVTRDGFQSEKSFIATADKVSLINELSECGYRVIEVTSFTSPKAIPMLSDAQQVMSAITRHPEVIYSALIPNLKGAQRALDCQVDLFNLVMSVSESHNRANLRMSCTESAEVLSEVIELAHQQGKRLNVSLSTSFGCPMEGSIAEELVVNWVKYFTQREVWGISLCDTTGMAYPSLVSSLSHRVQDIFTGVLTLHFHNTRGMGLANVLSGIQAGVRSFDASLGGLGGCPYAPGATGNITTEELVHMLDLMGFDTGMNLNMLLNSAQHLSQLMGRTLPSQLLKAGPITRLHKAPLQNH
ncbi:MAG: hydroxymethylglutaryl-CoA lyase [Ferrovum sp. 37-45-19]|jgi:hydroxymethylglutaryl-CoA lyase|nr:MAG: hydroxymethylglutaryl-CoA lyase [Ferrovum sp. 21-44-67]OYV94068.1 MAG: hydroxymethylglutaryl-CoA lyase [Ferrovum sp. 37-45-19]HQT82113.1 hydroxymethylglutaryl-CoA lyase [Ferrovaceae bacterium]HQU07373.1 hydroxymethylglutaryl-CoA lyase [Ferrovaceae bacterium]